MANSSDWQKRTMRPILAMLADAGGTLSRSQIQERLHSNWQASFDDFDVEVQTNGQERWWSYTAWGTTRIVWSGAMTKDGSGSWTITDVGRLILDEFPGDLEAHKQIVKLARARRRAAKAEAAEKGQRAWLVRGSSVLGANLVPEWLEGGWCSLAASQLPAIDTAVTRDELVTLAEAAYDHLKHQERSAKVVEITEFVTRMKPGD